MYFARYILLKARHMLDNYLQMRSVTFTVEMDECIWQQPINALVVSLILRGVRGFFYVSLIR